MARPELTFDKVPGAGMMFHHFHSEDYPAGQGSIDADALAEIIEFVGRDRVLDAAEWQLRAEKNRLHGGELCLTFDDSLACQYDVALPVLEAFDIRAFWFIYTSPLEGVMQRLEVYRYYRDVAFANIDDFYIAFNDQLENSAYADLVDRALVGFRSKDYLVQFPFYSDGDRRFRYIRDQVLGPAPYFALMDAMVKSAGYDPFALSRRLFVNAEQLANLHREGHVLGLHSHTHPTQLAALDRSKQAEEFARNRAHLQTITGGPIRAMSHPCNSYNADTLAILDEMDIGIGFRSNMERHTGIGRFEFPREDHANLMRAMRL